MKYINAFFALLCMITFSSLRPEIIIEEDSQEKEEIALSDYWDKHFSFRFGASSAMGLGKNDYRNYSFINLKWEHDFAWIAFAFEAEAYRRDYLYSLKVKSSTREDLEARRDIALEEGDRERADEAQGILNNLRSNIKFYAGENDISYREANIRFSLSNQLQLSLGYHLLVWGQISSFSPIDFVLPIRFASGSISFSKANNRLPQQSIIFSAFPIPQFEIQAYYFPELTLDKALRDGIESFGRARSEEIDERLHYIHHGFQYPEESEEPQYALRLLFYPDWAILAFTYYEGWDQFFPNNNAKIERYGGQDRLMEEISYYLFVEKQRMARIKNYGFEVAFPFKHWTLAVDILRRRVPENVNKSNLRLDAHNTLLYSSEVGREIGTPYYTQKAQIARQALIDYAIRENKGSLQYEVDDTIWAAELSATYDLWHFAFGLIGIEREASETKGKRLMALEQHVENASEDDDGAAIPAVPFFSLNRYISEDKKDIIGLAAGFMGGAGFGAILYFAQEYYESLQIGLSLEFLQLFSSFEAEDALNGYELEDAVYPALRWGMSYKF